MQFLWPLLNLLQNTTNTRIAAYSVEVITFKNIFMNYTSDESIILLG